MTLTWNVINSGNYIPVYTLRDKIELSIIFTRKDKGKCT